MSQPYNFRDQNRIGVAGEDTLDHHFRHIYTVKPASADEQSCGIDRWFWNDPGELPFAVEYKTDWVARKTDNAFIELYHTDRGERSGWAYTSKSHILVYYVPGPDAEMAYWVPFTALRAALPGWRLKYRTASVPNRTYKTVGLCVPLRELERIALHVFQP